MDGDRTPVGAEPAVDDDALAVLAREREQVEQDLRRRIGDAWDHADLPQTLFALTLRDLAAEYGEAPELAADGSGD